MPSQSRRDSGSLGNERDIFSPTDISTIQGSVYELPVFGSSDTSDIQPSWRSLFIFTHESHTSTVVFALTSTLLSACVKPASAIFFGRIFTSLTKYRAGLRSGDECLHDISKWCIALVCLGAASWAIEGAFFSSWVVFGELQAQSIRTQMFEGMLGKNMEWYDLREDGIGALLVRIQTQIRELQLAVSQPLGFITYETIGVLASLGVAFYFSWKMTFVVVTTFPIAGLLLYLASLKLGPAIESQKRELTQASKYANTAITNINTVKSYNGQDQEVWQYSGIIKRVSASYMVQAWSNALQHAVVKFMMVALFVEGFWFGIYLVNNGENPGHILTTFYACLNALQAVEIVLPQWLVLTKGMSAGATLETIMIQVRNGRRIMSMIGSYRPKSCSGDIEINGLSFTYPINPHQNALSGANFFFPAGETTFIVGPSGSGKSTVASLIMKYYEPSSGSILIDGQPLRTLDPDWLRHNVTLIQQQSVLFNETILQNIAFGQQGISTTDDIAEACYVADMEQMLQDLPDGLETTAGSSGQALSGGQQQKVAIARARLRDSPILILDEATSALDRISREAVMTNVRKWRAGKTTIIITHDVTQIQDDEYIYVLDLGRVVQEGYCTKLSKKTFGAFANLLAAMQLGGSSPIVPERGRSEPTSPIAPPSPTSRQFFSPRWSFMPSMQNMPKSSNNFNMNTNFRGSLLFGVGSAQANSLWTENIWSSPVIPNESIFQMTHLGLRKNSLNPFSTPEPVNFEDMFLESRRASQKRIMRPSSHPNSWYFSKTAEQPRTRPRKAIISPRARDSVQSSDFSSQDEPSFPIEIAPSIHATRKAASTTLILRTVWPNLDWNKRICLVIGFWSAFIVGSATPVFAYVFTKLLEVYYLPGDKLLEARKWALILLGIGIVDSAAMFSMHYALEHSSQAWVSTLRVEALRRILAQPRSWFDKNRNSADKLNAYLDRNAEEMRNLIGRFAGPIFTTFWMLLISIIWAMIISWKLTFVAMACGPIMWGLTQLFNLVSSRWEDLSNQAAEKAGSIFTETFTNIRVVRALTLESYFKRKHENAAIATFKVGMKRALYSGMFFGLGDVMSYFIIAAIFYYATAIITRGENDLPAIFQVVNLLMFGIANSTALLMIVPQLSSSRTTATYLLHLANLPLRKAPEALGKRRLKTPFPICLDNLSFTYPFQPNRILHNISFTIQPGTCTGIVGPSGSGKSTIASLLLGLYAPDDVSFHNHSPLTFNGVPMAQCNMTSLRSQISIVAQQPLLFPSSVLSNILYGLPEGSPLANVNAAKQAARDAEIHGFVMSLPNGYATSVGEGGMGLSGGQAQRIAIARALVRKPRILILDEATSALDSVTAEGVRDTVRRLIHQGKASHNGGVAVVIISHALEMMRVCDQVVMIEDGHVVESGTFDELKFRGGAFSGFIGSDKGSARTTGIVRGLV